MNWETEDASEAKSGMDSAVIWSDDPEKAYFRSMINARKGGMAAEGKDYADSLIGDSTLAGMMEGKENTDSHVGDSTIGRMLEEQSLQTFDPPRSQPKGSGLGLEGDAIAKVAPAQPFTRSWFASKNRVSKFAREELAVPTNLQGLESPVWDTVPEAEKRTPNSAIQVTKNQGPSDKNGEFPAFIFVTSGHSSAVETELVAKQGIFWDPLDDESIEGNTRRRRLLYATIGIVSIIFLIAITMLSIAFKERRADLNAPTFPPVFDFPSLTPPAPTPSPTRAARPDGFLDFEAKVLVSSPQSSDALADPSSPQYRAAEWYLSQSSEAMNIFSTSRLIQRWTLATLYFSTNGNGWSLSTSWLSDENECEWYAVFCDDENDVKGLELRNNNLAGLIPPELGTMSNADFIALSRNSLTGTLPTELGLLDDLKTLDLARNKLTGSIPPEYGGMSSVEILSFRDNQISGTIPSELGTLALLESMILVRNDISGDMPEELCALEIDLNADCEEVSCECCNECCIDGGGCYDNTKVPTKAPTLLPTPIPTNAPTKAPTGEPSKQPTSTPSSNPTSPLTASPTSFPTRCKGTIRTDKECYTSGEDIIVSFENCNPEADDWIGIYGTNEDYENLGFPRFWVWTCGDQQCSGLVESGTATFTEARGRGNFQVLLVRNTGEPYKAHAIGNRFTIDSSCLR